MTGNLDLSAKSTRTATVGIMKQQRHKMGKLTRRRNNTIDVPKKSTNSANINNE